MTVLNLVFTELYRTVPHALKVKVEQALQQLMYQKVIEQVLMTDWAAPIVPVLNPDGSIKICDDYKITINREIIYKGNAYNQIPLDKSSKQYVTINTHKGMFRYS